MSQEILVSIMQYNVGLGIITYLAWSLLKNKDIDLELNNHRLKPVELRTAESRVIKAEAF